MHRVLILRVMGSWARLNTGDPLNEAGRVDEGGLSETVLWEAFLKVPSHRLQLNQR